MRYRLELNSVGNPDYGQYSPISEPETVFVESMVLASMKCREYIRKWDLGGGNWVGGMIHDTFNNGKKIAIVSYNGRVWDMKGREINL